MENKTIFLTGANGFLGSHILTLLLAKNFNVVALIRNPKKCRVVHPRFKIYAGDLLNTTLLEQIFKDEKIDGVIHTASKVSLYGKYQDFYQQNYLVCQNLIQVLEKNQCKNLIYTSTPSVVFNGYKNIEDGDESLPYCQSQISKYAYTKMMAEKMLIHYPSREINIIALRPHLIMGENEPHMIPKIIKAQKNGKLRIVGDGNNQVEISDVNNIAKAHVMALEFNFHRSLPVNLNENSPYRAAYFLGDKKVFLWPYIDEILKKNQLPKIHKNISFKKAYLIGSIFEVIYRLLPMNPESIPMTRFSAIQLATTHTFSSNKFIAEIGNFRAD